MKLKSFFIVCLLLISTTVQAGRARIFPELDLDGYLETAVGVTRTTAPVNYYVDGATGSDVTGNGSALLPFATIQHAIDSLPYFIDHECWIYVSSGTYANKIVINKSSSAQEMTPAWKRKLFIRGATTEALATATANSGTRSSITDTGNFAGANYAGYFVELLSGPNYIDLGTYNWFTNLYPILSNDDNTLQLPILSSAFSSSTQYRIVSLDTTIRGDATINDFGITNVSGSNVTVQLQRLNFTRNYNEVFNVGGDMWVQSSSFEFDTIGYSAIMMYPNATGYLDGNYITGAYTNASIGNNDAGSSAIRFNVIVNGKSGVESDASNYVFMVGNVIDTMTEYGIKVVNNTSVKGSNNVNTGSRINNCSGAAIYAVGGGFANVIYENGTGNAVVARLIGASNVYYNSTRLLATGTYTFDDAGGRVVDQASNIVYRSGSEYNYVASNDGNPIYRIGSSATEYSYVQSVFDTGAQTLDYLKIGTETAGAVADEGDIKFYPDGVNTVNIDDGGIDLMASMGISVAGTDIITDAAGTATLSNIDAFDLTTIATIEASIDADSVGLGNVENTALSTWAGSTNITTLGTISGNTAFTLGAGDRFYINGTATPQTQTFGALAVDVTTATNGVFGTRFDLENTSTLGIGTTSLYANASSSAVVTAGNQSLYGAEIYSTKSGADTNGDGTNVRGVNVQAQNTGSTDTGTKQTMGGYFSAVGDTAGTSTAYGLYSTATGADTNWGLYIEAGNSYLAGDLSMTGSIASTDSRVTKGWFTDIESTNAPTVGGSSVYYATGADVAVTDGGTGASSLTDGGVLLGSGTNAVTAMAVLADGEMIVGDGTTDPVAESGATLRTSIGVGTGDSPTFAGQTIGANNGASMTIGVLTEVVVIPDLANNGVSTTQLLPANSEILGLAFYTTDGVGGPALTVNMGPSGGTANLFIDAADVSDTGDSGNMYANGATFQHRPNYFNASANTIALALSGSTPVSDSLSIRIIVWYRQIVEPTS